MSSTATNLGTKYTCFKCECRFYDLGRTEPLCPRCGADQRENPEPSAREAFLARYRRPSKGRKSKSKSKTAAPKVAVVEADKGEDLLDDDFAANADQEPAKAAPKKKAPAKKKAAAKKK